jgi:deazaflavin-dependent oxidoreductase (nitroreductase family)
VEAESAYRWRAKEDRMSEQADGTGGADAAGAADVVDSPTDWVNKHIKNYVATDGEQGHVIQAGAPVLLLTVVGRRTGVLRRTALIYGRDGENYVVVASAGGAPGHPAWYLNLAANGEVQVQVLAEKFTALARAAAGEERDRLWAKMAEIWPDYNDYQTKTGRQIPIVVLEPAMATR